jgi:protein-S-isoprenylcysteine O-methyltransferase Ste14
LDFQKTTLCRPCAEPRYFAFSLFQAGIAIGINDGWILVTLSTAISVISFFVIPREERYLEARFGEEHKV